MLQQPLTEFQLLVKALGYVRTHWWLFLLEIIVIYGSALNNYHRTPPVYESKGSILIDNSRKQLYNAYVLSSNTSNRRQNMAHLLTSQEIMERLRNQLTDHYNAEGRPVHLRVFFPDGNPISAQQLRGLIILDWDKSSDIYHVLCKTNHPDTAHDICLAYMNTIQSYYPEIGQRDAMMRRDFLSRQIASLTRQIAERERSLAEFQNRSPDFMNFLLMDVEDKGRMRIKGQINSMKEALATNRAMKALLVTGPAAKKGEYAAMQPAIQALTERVAELQYQIKLTEKSNNPEREQRLWQLNEQLKQAERQLAELHDEEVEAIAKSPITAASVRGKIADLELEYRTGLIRLRALEKQLEDLNEREKKFQQQRLEYDRLNADLVHRRNLLKSLYSKEQQAELELSAGNAEIFRLQEPTRNTERTAPHLSRYLYGSLSLCIFVLIVTCIFLMAFFPRLDSEAEVNRLNLPIIGKVPALRFDAQAFEKLPGLSLEHLKIMNYRILRETKETKCPIVVVTSAHAREGKSTVAHLLSLASQTPNRRTLFIDGDLITFHPNRFFGIQEDQTPGLHALLTAKTHPPFESLVTRTGYEGVDYLPRGERMEPTAEPTFLKPLERELEKLRSQYDVIYIDTPPMFAANLAHQWVGIANLIVVVARLYVTRPRDVIEAMQTCRVFSKAPVGIALNCVVTSVMDRRVSNYYFSRKRQKPSGLAA